MCYSGLRVDGRKSAGKVCRVETWAPSVRWTLQGAHLSSGWSVWANWKENQCQTKHPKRLKTSRRRKSLWLKQGSLSQVTLKYSQQRIYTKLKNNSKTTCYSFKIFLGFDNIAPPLKEFAHNQGWLSYESQRSPEYWVTGFNHHQTVKSGNDCTSCYSRFL